MKIGVSGAHRTGKTTLIAELGARLPAFHVIHEPYRLLEEEGYAFADPPGMEDFELQLRRSIGSIEESSGDCLFDRTPTDFLAYMICHDDSEGFDIGAWLPEVLDAMQRLDLVVFVPIEDPDRVTQHGSDHRRLRRRVDEELYDIVLQDRWTFGVPVVEVSGSPEERVRRVLAYLAEQAEPR